VLERTIGTTSAVVRASRLPPDRIAAVLLVGGSSRIPLVATLLRDALGVAPATVDQPELVVAAGSVQSRQTPSIVDEPAPAPVRVERARPSGVLAPPADPWATAVTDDDLVPYVPALALDEDSAPGTALVPTVWPEPEPQPEPVSLPAPARPYGRARPVHVSSPFEEPLALPAAPATPVSGPPAGAATPPARGPAPKPRGPYLGTVVNTRSRPRWLRGGLAAVGALALATAAVLVGPRVLAGGPEPGAAAGPGPAGTTLPGQAPSDAASGQALAPYLRMATPAWLPAGWTKVVDDGPDGGAIMPGDATPKGSCTYSGPGVFRVVRDAGDVAACRMRGYVRQIRVRNGAVEAQFALTRGCAALWMRTSNVGYLAMACANGAVELHELGNRPPGPASRRAVWRPAFDPANVVVGLLAQGSRLTVYVDGVKAGTVDDGSIGVGRVGVGGFAPTGGLDATVTDFRAWRAT
jgi:hypothetical protein